MRRFLLVILILLGLFFIGSPLAVKTAQAATPQYNEVQNADWSGYSASFSHTQTPLSVSAAWTVPYVNCDKNQNPVSGEVAVWVGLGGTGSDDMEQIGTDSQCINGFDKYWAWYQFVPSMNQAYPIMNDGNFPVFDGDSMRADVTEQGSHYFVLRIFDDTQGWYYVKIFINKSANYIPKTAEWIVEYPPGDTTFPYFYNVLFTNCYWVQNSPQQPLKAGANLTRYTISRFGSQKETTLDVFPDGTDFAVYWNNF